MIKVTVGKNSNGEYNRVCMDGHAGYGEHGQDIVCAAVSALFINTVNSIETFTEDSFHVDENTKDDRVELVLTSEISPESSLFMKSLLLGLQGIEEEYGKKYIKVLI